MKTQYYQPLATTAGGLLAIMILLNGVLSKFTTPFISSFIVHIVGFAGSLVLWAVFSHVKFSTLFSTKAPIWSYCGGFGGAFAVVLSNAAVNSELGLVGSLSCFILGQTIMALIIDRFGLFGSAKRRLSRLDVLKVGLILIGALMLIQAGGQV